MLVLKNATGSKSWDKINFDGNNNVYKLINVYSDVYGGTYSGYIKKTYTFMGHWTRKSVNELILENKCGRYKSESRRTGTEEGEFNNEESMIVTYSSPTSIEFAPQ